MGAPAGGVTALQNLFRQVPTEPGLAYVAILHLAPDQPSKLSEILAVAAARGDGIAMVLSGAGADGAVGVRAIKEAGGVVMVQDPGEAGFASMPKNAIASGVSDSWRRSRGSPRPGGGYGRELIERALPYALKAKTRYELGDDGVRCTIDLPVCGTVRLSDGRPAPTGIPGAAPS